MDVIHWLFHGLCHQIPSRALSGGGWAMPLCARCAGLYVGFAVGLGPMLLLGRRARGLPTRFFMGASFIAFAAFAADGAGGFFSLWQAAGAVRFATGMAAGVFLSPYVALLYHNTVGADEPSAPICGARTAVWMLIAVGVFFGLNGNPAKWLLVGEAYAAAAGVAMLLVVAHTAILVLALGRKRYTLARLAAPVTALGQLALFSALRSLAGV